MKLVRVFSLEIPDVRVLEFARCADSRGYFSETFRPTTIGEIEGMADFRIEQINESFSHPKVVRGLHLQWEPFQGKLVRCVRGRVIDLALDVRRHSPTFGRIVAHELLGDPDLPSGQWIFVPPGFAHGVVFPEAANIEYLCTATWNGANEAGISPLAPDIDWSLCEARLRDTVRTVFAAAPIISDKDRHAHTVESWLSGPHSQHFTFDEAAPYRCAPASPRS